ncbi:MAG TPA: hypothetical protein VG245_07185 [Candidatus Dormibacteraeota bacterium]|nr:hypothetical protein [Candidatus Dormibacteraeota bacterium]
MEWTEVARQWEPWAAAAFPGEADRQRRAVDAAVRALQSGQSREQAVAAAQAAGAGPAPAAAPPAAPPATGAMPASELIESKRAEWAAWAATAIGREPGRQAFAVEAALQALRKGQPADVAATAARSAASFWQGQGVTPPAADQPAAGSPEPIAGQPVGAQGAPGAGFPVMAPGQVAAGAPAGLGSPYAAPGAPPRPPLPIWREPRIVGIAGAGVLVLALLAAALVLVGHPPTTVNAEAAKSADAIAADAAAGLRRLGSFHAVLTLKAGNGHADIYYADARTAEQEFNLDGRDFTVLAVGGHQYLKGNAAFFAQNPVLAQHAANQWIIAGDGATLLNPADNAPATGAGCIFGKHGSLAKGARTTIAGRPAIEIDDRGDVPGSTPAKFFIAIDGQPDLLRIVETGVTKGTIDASCHKGFDIQVSDAAALSTIDMTEFNRTYGLVTPATFINLGDRPYCGQAVAVNLRPAAQQYLLLVYADNLAKAAIEQRCNCAHLTLETLRQALNDEISAAQMLITGLRALPSDAQANADVASLIVALNSLISAAQQSTPPAGVSTYPSTTPARVAANQRVAQLTQKVRTDLGLPAATCGFTIP